MKRIRQFLSVLAVTALAAAGIGTWSALAASRSVPKTKAQWQADIGHLRQPGTGCYRAVGCS